MTEACKFKTLHEEVIRERLVLGCRDKAARARLFRQKESDLKNAVESLRISEATQEQLRKIGDEESETVNAVKGKGQSEQTTTPRHREQRQTKFQYKAERYQANTMQILWKSPRTRQMSSLWQSLSQLWQRKSFPGSVSEWSKIVPGRAV